MSNLNDFVIENGVLKRYEGDGGGVTIPDIVTEIGTWAFRGCDTLTSVTIPDSVIKFGYGAFADCSNITSISIPDSITEIEENAFYRCTKLVDITIPNSITSIGDCAFAHCTSLTSITIPDSVKTIGAGTFASCTNLATISIPQTEITIGQRAFNNCPCLVDDKGFVIMGNTLFDYSGDSENVIVPTSVNFINHGTFYYMEKLKTITIPSNVITIGNQAFEHCVNLTSVIFSDGIENIGEGAFKNCKKLLAIDIPSSVKTIGKYAFSNIGAKDVVIPSSVKHVGGAAFDEATNIVAYDSIEEDATTVDQIESTQDFHSNSCMGILSLHDCTITIKSAKTGDAKFKFWMPVDSESSDVCHLIRRAWEANAEFAFNYFDTKIFSLFKVFDNKIINAFYRLHYKYNLSDENEKKYRAWFKKNGAKVLLKLVEWDNIEMLAELITCDIITANNIDKAIDLANEKGRTEILSILMNYKHTHFSMDELEKAEKQRVNKELQAPIEPKIDWRKEFTFKAVDGGTAIIKYGGSSTDIIVPDVVNKKRIVEIADDAFSTHRYGLKTVDRNILRNIVSITLPESICRIGGCAFKRCEKLASINIPEGVVSIGYEAFIGCKGLVSIQIPNSVSKIGGHAFSKCTKLATITIPGSVSEIALETFRDCAKLKTVVLENGVESVGRFAFANCGKLELVTIPKSVTSIDKTAFLDCNNLTIRTPAGSYAEQYAKTNNINFVTE